MNSIDVAERLKDLDDAWEAADPAALSGNIEDGEYQASVQRFDFMESKKTGSLQLVTEFEIVAPDHIGRTVKVWHDLEVPDRLKWTKAHLELLGVKEVKPFSSLESRLSDALDTVCEITLKSKTVAAGKTYQNVYLNRVLEGVKVEREKPAAPVTTDNAPPHGDDDIPF